MREKKEGKQKKRYEGDTNWLGEFFHFLWQWGKRAHSVWVTWSDAGSQP